jgi:hypothetical protein
MREVRQDMAELLVLIRRGTAGLIAIGFISSKTEQNIVPRLWR